MADHMTAEQLQQRIVELLDELTHESHYVGHNGYRDERSIAEVRGDLDAAIACLSALPAQGVPDGWLPIGSAPRDGAEILAAWPKVELDDDCEPTGKVLSFERVVTKFSGGYWVEPDHFEANGPSFNDDWEYAQQPTHWQPLPPAPKANDHG